MYRTVAQLDQLTSVLAGWWPNYFTRIQLPETSVEGRPVYALRLRAGSGGNRRAVLMIGGTHARELMNPDALAELAIDLMVSHINGSDVHYGGFSMPAATVKTVLESMDLWFVPCINPDGRAYVQSTDDLWRKNRRDNPGTPFDGVDLNRNCGFLHGVAQGQTSCTPSSEVYCGPSAFSEPESRNVRWLLDTYQVATFVDVHSYSEFVMWPWGHAPTQTTDASQVFTTLATETCTASIPSTYAEYLTPRDHQRFATVGQRIADAIHAVRGRPYVSKASLDLYPTTGCFDDYAWSRHTANPALGRTYGFTFETGPWTGDARTSFHPADPEPVKLDAKAGLLTLAQQSICAIDFVGADSLSARVGVSVARRLRDAQLVRTDGGRAWIEAFEELSPALATAALTRRGVRKRGRDLLRRLARLADDPQAVLDREDLAAVDELLTKIEQRAADSHRELLATARATLPKLAGLPLGAAVDKLAAAPPGRLGDRVAR